MYAIFHGLTNTIVKLYINDVVVKSQKRQHKLKMNCKKMLFGSRP